MFERDLPNARVKFLQRFGTSAAFLSSWNAARKAFSSSRFVFTPSVTLIPQFFFITNIVQALYLPETQSYVIRSADQQDSGCGGSRLVYSRRSTFRACSKKRFWDFCRSLHIIHCEEMLAHQCQVEHLLSVTKRVTLKVSYVKPDIIQTCSFPKFRTFLFSDADDWIHLPSILSLFSCPFVDNVKALHTL